MRKKVDNGQTALSRRLQGARERTSPFVRPYENENYEMEKELERSWGEMGEGTKTATGIAERGRGCSFNTWNGIRLSTAKEVRGFRDELRRLANRPGTDYQKI